MRSRLPWLAVLASVLISAAMLCAEGAHAYPPGPSAEERQAKALEKIASELEQLRRCGCRK